MTKGSGEEGGITHGDPVWNEVTLVNNQDDLFMGFLLFDILQHRLAHRSDWISGIEDVEDNVGRVNDFVKLAIDTPRGSFRVNRLDVVCVSLFFGGNDLGSVSVRSCNQSE